MESNHHFRRVEPVPRPLDHARMVESEGIEPSLPECHSGVLPLDDNPVVPQARIERASPVFQTGALTLYATRAIAPRMGIEPISTARQAVCDPIASRGLGYSEGNDPSPPGPQPGVQILYTTSTTAVGPVGIEPTCHRL